MQHTLSRLLGALDISRVLDPTYAMLWDWSVDTWSHLDKFIYKLLRELCATSKVLQLLVYFTLHLRRLRSSDTQTVIGVEIQTRGKTLVVIILWSERLFACGHQRKQSIVALSTCEAEYVAATTSACQSVWLSNIITQIGFNLDVPIKIYVDNVFAINLEKNPVFHQTSKHIDIRYHFLRDQVGKNMIKLEYCRSENQIADILTKPLMIDAFIKLRDLLGMKVVPPNQT